MPLSRARFMVRLGLALIFLVGLAFVVSRVYASLSTDPPSPRTTADDIEFFIGFVIAGTGLLIAWVGWRTLTLASDANTIARWTVPLEEWQRYVAACNMRIAMPGALPGSVPLDLPVGAAGIEVLALKRGFRVGDTFHELGGLSADILDIRVVDSPADMFEFNVIYATGKSSSIQRGVRIPIATYAKKLANDVEDFWIKKEPLQTLTPDQLRARARSGWTLCFVGLIAFLGTIALFVVINPPGWAALAPLGTLALTFYGFARGLRARNVLWRKYPPR